MLAGEGFNDENLLNFLRVFLQSSIEGKISIYGGGGDQVVGGFKW